MNFLSILWGLLLGTSATFAQSIAFSDLKGSWTKLTTIDNEKVRFDPCDADNGGFEIATKNEKNYLYLYSGLDVSTFIITKITNKEDKLVVNAQMEGNNVQNFEFRWVDKPNGLAHFGVEGDESEYVQNKYETRYTLITQPCIECEGTDCENLTDQDRLELELMKKIVGTWVSADDPNYTIKFENTSNFATGTKYEYYQKEELNRFNYSFYNGKLSIYDVTTSINELQTIVELTANKLVLSGPTGQNLIFKRRQ